MRDECSALQAYGHDIKSRSVLWQVVRKIDNSIDSMMGGRYSGHARSIILGPDGDAHLVAHNQRFVVPHVGVEHN